MKRNTKQLIPMILVFTIIAAGYSCRMLAMFDIGGAWAHLNAHSTQNRRVDDGVDVDGTAKSG